MWRGHRAGQIAPATSIHEKRLVLLLLLPPAQPDSAEEPFWNFNWKHFPPRLPERGRERGSPPAPRPLGTAQSNFKAAPSSPGGGRRGEKHEVKAEEQQGSLGSSKPGRAGGFAHQHRQGAEGRGARGRGPVPVLGAWVPPSTSLSEEAGAGSALWGLVPKYLPISLPPQAHTRGSPGSHKRVY